MKEKTYCEPKRHNRHLGRLVCTCQVAVVELICERRKVEPTMGDTKLDPNLKLRSCFNLLMLGNLQQSQKRRL